MPCTLPNPGINTATKLTLVCHTVQQVMVANIRCGEILNDQLRALQEDQAWTSLVHNAQQHLIPDFGSQASDLLESCLTGILQPTCRLLQQEHATERLLCVPSSACDKQCPA